MDSRLNRKGKKMKKRTVLKRIILISMILLLSVIGYSGYQYFMGIKEADASIKKKHEFNAPEQKVKGTFNVLLLGSDARNGEEISRTDTIMIAQYNTETNKPKLVSIMRDTYVTIPGYGNNKINAAFFHGGPELLRQTIKQNFDIDIHYYAMVNFEGFEKIIDVISPDGIEINIEKQMSKQIGVTLEPGLHKLNGKELLGYARFRHDRRGDFGRVERQQEVISSIKNEFTSLYGISKLPKVIGTLQQYIDTNLETLTIFSIATEVMLNKSEIETMVIPIDGSFTEPTYQEVGQVLEIDFEKNKNAIHDFLR
ncbi:LCP family protein [Bacillus solitudinis]|uniref:LCP family protein n=1 Tax=Bacillus solitudinis TaxID=2014074 RepID=UPI000C23EBDE|nr:LCP family protein [Bacillus solitudinis]